MELQTDDAIEASVQAILMPPDWLAVRVRRLGPYWDVNGVYRGRTHSGARADAISLAKDLAEIAAREWDAAQIKPQEPPPEEPAAPAILAIIESSPPPDVEEPQPPPPPPPPPAPDPHIIPDELAHLVAEDENAAAFRERVKKLWQRFGIADGHHFPGGGEALTAEEKITMREIDIANQKAGNWLGI